MIKEAFVDSYKLLSLNTNFETEEFLNLMQDTMNKNNKQIVDYVIVGGYDENGVMNPYLIRFILKQEFDLSIPEDVSEKFIVTNNKIDLNSNNVLVDFINTRKYFSYERDRNGKLNKVLRNGLRIRVECDIT